MTGIICAMQLEADGIIAKMTGVRSERISGGDYHSGSLYGCPAVVAVCGVGKVYAAVCAQTMILRFAVDEIINVGVAGALIPELRVFDIVLADRLVQHDMDTTALGDKPGMISGINEVYLPASPRLCGFLADCLEVSGLGWRRGTIATGDQFIDSESDRARIAGSFGALACEMEGGAVAQVCYINGVDFAVLRAISDSGEGDFARFAARAAENSAHIICMLMERRTRRVAAPDNPIKTP